MPKWRKNGEVDGELEIKALQLYYKYLYVRFRRECEIGFFHN